MRYLLLLILLTSCASDVDHEERRWPGNQVTYSINPIVIDGVSQVKANEVIRRAFSEWEESGVVKFRYVMNGQIVVDTKDLKGNVAGFGYFPNDGRLLIDSSNRTWTESLLFRVVLHEIGHTLGLRHNKCKESIMYYRILNTHKLSRKDKDNIRRLYE